jgi:hypothetical protein
MMSGQDELSALLGKFGRVGPGGKRTPSKILPAISAPSPAYRLSNLWSVA